MYKRWQNLVQTIILSVIMEMRKDYPCFLCGRQVRPRQQALECDTDCIIFNSFNCIDIFIVLTVYIIGICIVLTVYIIAFVPCAFIL